MATTKYTLNESASAIIKLRIDLYDLISNFYDLVLDFWSQEEADKRLEEISVHEEAICNQIIKLLGESIHQDIGEYKEQSHD